MQTFEDTAGRTWNLSLSIGRVRAIKGSSIGIDLLRLNVGKPTLLTRLFTEVELVIDCIWFLVMDQAEEKGVGELEFAAALDGEAAWQASMAFYSELTNFCLQLRRTADAKATEKMQRTVELATEKAVGRIDEIDVEQFVDDAMAVEIPIDPLSAPADIES